MNSCLYGMALVASACQAGEPVVDTGNDECITLARPVSLETEIGGVPVSSLVDELQQGVLASFVWNDPDRLIKMNVDGTETTLRISLVHDGGSITYADPALQDEGYRNEGDVLVEVTVAVSSGDGALAEESQGKVNFRPEQSGGFRPGSLHVSLEYPLDGSLAVEASDPALNLNDALDVDSTVQGPNSVGGISIGFFEGDEATSADDAGDIVGGGWAELASWK